MVEQARATIAAQANHTATRLYRQIGTMINTSILQEKRRIWQTDCIDAGDTIGEQNQRNVLHRLSRGDHHAARECRLRSHVTLETIFFDN